MSFFQWCRGDLETRKFIKSVVDSRLKQMQIWGRGKNLSGTLRHYLDTLGIDIRGNCVDQGFYISTVKVCVQTELLVDLLGVARDGFNGCRESWY